MNGMKSLDNPLEYPGNPSLCTAAVVTNSKGEFLLGLRNYKKNNKKNSLWTTPGGRAEVGETIGECLLRETFEETNLHITPISFLGKIPGARSGDELFVFHCKHSGDLENKEPEKFETWQWFSFSGVPKNFINRTLLGLLKEV